MKGKRSDCCDAHDRQGPGRRNRRNLSVADRRGQSGGLAAAPLRAALGQDHVRAADPGGSLGDPSAARADPYRHAGRLSHGGHWAVALPSLYRPAQRTEQQSDTRSARPPSPDRSRRVYRRLDKSGAPVSWGLRLFNGGGEQQVTILLPNPFLSADGDKVLKTPEWSRLDLWDRLRARWLDQPEPDPFDRSGRGFSHG